MRFRPGHIDPTALIRLAIKPSMRAPDGVTRRGLPCYSRCVQNRTRGETVKTPLKTILTIGLFVALGVATAQQAGVSHFDGNSWWSHVKYLADDSLEGRDTGSEGLRKAQAYAVEQFKKAGLEPAGSDGFYQPVSFMQYELDESKSSLALVANGETKPLSFADEAFFSTRATHESVQVTAPLVFAGYGLKIPEKNLDELAGMDLKGKIIVYLAGSPSDIPTALASH